MSSSSSYREKELLPRIAEGDEQAFAEYFYQSSPDLLLTIRQLVKTEEAALDLVQEVYIKAWLHRAELVHMEFPTAWLKRVAVNKSMNYLRRARIEANWVRSAAAGEEPRQFRMEGVLLARELQLLIREAVDRLPGKRREVYIRNREQGLDRSEIAAAMGLSENTVRNHLALATQEIRDFLLKKGVLLWVVVAGIRF
ncbi:MAG: sigma-70 family RNA polymerase sigma factor [Candidatus Pseudobacter hemicellulosilyticus]|uniref:RNA polymerase sigma factor n=1 Tax=Candidatus Pseudobacter hemicellulosilyticus TaxID=3121375 RepID=A0AAJ5WXQ8_9BACT|nr:MAG: sigma-70 family RNA polymerase sigma factor [Pseudobacter sp.]